MTRFFHLLYYFLLIFLVLVVIYMSVMLAISPKNDMQKRGFIPCTEKLVIDVSSCERGKMLCPLKYLWQDMECNMLVIADGLGNWVRGKQNRPWSNYLFEPDLALEDDVEYEGNIVADMADLEAQSQFINHKKQELENAKNRSLNLCEDVLMSDPEVIDDKSSKNEIIDEIEQEEAERGDIADEAFMEEIEEGEKDE